MGLIHKMLIDDAVYWAPKSGTDAAGNKVFEQPVDIKVRWEEGSEEEVDDAGTRRLATARVWTNMTVDQEGRSVIPETGGYLMQGTRAELSKLQPPPRRAFEIMGTKEAKNVRGSKIARWSLL